MIEMDQELQLMSLMRGLEPKLLTAGQTLTLGCAGFIDENCGQTLQDTETPELEFTRTQHIYEQGETGKAITDDPTLVASSEVLETQASMSLQNVGTISMCSDHMDVLTPEPIRVEDSDCKIVGNKWQTLMDDECNHSKWEEFRRMAKAGSSHEECSLLLRRMELQDSDDESEV